MIYDAVDHLHYGPHQRPSFNALNDVSDESYVMQASGTTSMRKDVAASEDAGQTELRGVFLSL
jgi:hypothetical protein